MNGWIIVLKHRRDDMTKVHEYMTLARYMYVERKTAVLTIITKHTRR